MPEIVCPLCGIDHLHLKLQERDRKLREAEHRRRVWELRQRALRGER